MEINLFVGERAELKMLDDWSFIPKEVIERVVGPFMVIGNEEKAYIMPKPPDKPITIRYLGEWVMNSKDDYTIEFSRPATDEEKREILNAINNGDMILEEVI
jgi:hypothetical protein